MELLKQILLVSGGVSVVITGLATFLGKIWTERILAKERKSIDVELKKEQAKLDKGLHIHKVKFEKEFLLYQDIWGKLVDLKRAALTLRPMLDSVSRNESNEDRKSRRLKEYHEALNLYVDAVEYSQPFYAEDVYSSLQAVLDATYKESVEYRCGEERDQDYWNASQKNSKEIFELIQVCQKAIRKRYEDVHVFE